MIVFSLYFFTIENNWRNKKANWKEKEVIFGGFNNNKLLKGNNKYHQIFIFGSNK